MFIKVKSLEDYPLGVYLINKAKLEVGTIRVEQNDEDGTQALVLDKPISIGIIEEINPRTDDMTPRQ